MLAALSHELRNPLAGLASSLYVLKGSQPGSPRAQRAMAIMERQVGRLSLLINSLTDAVRIDQGKVTLRLEVVDLCEVMRDAASAHEDLFTSREVKVQTQLAGRPVLVSADEARLQEILGELLDNAARFAPPGSRVVLGVECDEAVRVARMRVQDFGIGMKPGMCECVFRPFSRVDDSPAHSQGGLGLGLVLVKGLVELHGGAVRAQSDGPDRGSVFTIELPLAT